jgi:hypothetical protein
MKEDERQLDAATRTRGRETQCAAVNGAVAIQRFNSHLPTAVTSIGGGAAFGAQSCCSLLGQSILVTPKGIVSVGICVILNNNSLDEDISSFG